MDKKSNSELFQEMQNLKEQNVPFEQNYARNKLINDNYDLVKFVVNKFYGSNENLEELISIGTIGLINAIDTFDESKGFKFSTYATEVIKNEINTHFQSNETAKRIIQKYTISIDTPVGSKEDGKELTIEGILADEESDKFPDIIAQNDEIKFLRKKLTHLTPDEQIVLVLNYGLYGGQRMSVKNISELLNIQLYNLKGILDSGVGKLKEIFSKTKFAEEIQEFEYPLITNYEDYLLCKKHYKQLLPYTKVFRNSSVSLKEIKENLMFLTPMQQFALCSTYQIYNQEVAKFDSSIISSKVLNENLNSARKKLVQLIFFKRRKNFRPAVIKELTSLKYALIKSQKDMLQYLNIDKFSIK